MKAHCEKLKNILALTPEPRYEYFIRKITDFETLWGCTMVGGQQLILKQS